MYEKNHDLANKSITFFDPGIATDRSFMLCSMAGKNFPTSQRISFNHDIIVRYLQLDNFRDLNDL